MTVTIGAVLAEAMALREGAAGDVVGDDPIPHGDDFWISTEDVLDYARWIDRRVREVDDAFQLALRTGDAARVAAAAGFGRDWVPWVSRWRTFLAGLESSWWDRVNAWESCRVFHNELRALIDRANTLGMSLKPIGPPPDDKDALIDLVTDVREAALPTGVLLVAGLVAAAVLLRR